LWRLPAFGAIFALSMFGGFRSTLLFTGILISVMFFLEGLHKTRWVFLIALVAGLTLAVVVPNANKFPKSVQRVLSVVPFADIDPTVRRDAVASWDWRVRMWKAVLPEAPQYFWLGKGYKVTPLEIFLAQEAVRRNLAPDYESFIATGLYHNGPLSVYMPFGAPGSLAFLAFLAASMRVLYLNQKHGRQHCKTVNRFLFAFFITKAIFFLGFFGALAHDMATFAGIAGLSVAINGGVCVAAASERKLHPQAVTQFRIAHGAG
jgi:hypothetical protein